MLAPVYPFVPKSTRWLKRGQFWAIPLGRCRYGAGCVVGMHTVEGKPSTRMFVAGVVGWVGTKLPSAEVLQGRTVVKVGFAHVKAITESGGSVLGEAELELSGVPPESPAKSLPAWGLGFPRLVAERLGKNGG